MGSKRGERDGELRLEVLGGLCRSFGGARPLVEEFRDMGVSVLEILDGELQLVSLLLGELGRSEKGLEVSFLSQELEDDNVS